MEAPRLLIADSHRVSTEDLASCLRRLGYGIAGTVTTGVEAVAEAQEKRPDLVMVDLNVQGHVDATTAAKDIGTGLGIPVVYVAGADSGHLLSGSYDTGAYGYLFKPFTERHLHTVVEAALCHADKDKVLRETAGLYSTLLRMAPTPLVLRTQTRILLANEAARHGTGLYGSDAMIAATSDTTLLHSKDPPEHTGDATAHHTVIIRTAEGEEAVLELARATALLNGESVFLIAGRDVSVQTRAELTLRRAEALLGALNDAHQRCMHTHETPQLLDGLLTGLVALTVSTWGWMGEVLYDEEGAPRLGTSVWAGKSTSGENPSRPEDVDDVPLPWEEMEQHIGISIATEEPTFVRAAVQETTSPGDLAAPAYHTQAAVLPLHSGNKFVAVAALGGGPLEYDEQNLSLVQPYLTLCAFMMEAHRYHKRHKEQCQINERDEGGLSSSPSGLISLSRW